PPFRTANRSASALLLAVHAGDARLARLGADGEGDGALAVVALAHHHAAVPAGARVLALGHLEAGALELRLVEVEHLGHAVAGGEAEGAAALRAVLGRVDALGRGARVSRHPARQLRRGTERSGLAVGAVHLHLA